LGAPQMWVTSRRDRKAKQAVVATGGGGRPAGRPATALSADGLHRSCKKAPEAVTATAVFAVVAVVVGQDDVHLSADIDQIDCRFGRRLRVPHRLCGRLPGFHRFARSLQNPREKQTVESIFSLSHPLRRSTMFSAVPIFPCVLVVTGRRRKNRLRLPHLLWHDLHNCRRWWRRRRAERERERGGRASCPGFVPFVLHPRWLRWPPFSTSLTVTPLSLSFPSPPPSHPPGPSFLSVKSFTRPKLWQHGKVTRKLKSNDALP
jgi:hypothetical protein